MSYDIQVDKADSGTNTSPTVSVNIDEKIEKAAAPQVGAIFCFQLVAAQLFKNWLWTILMT